MCVVKSFSGLREGVPFHRFRSCRTEQKRTKWAGNTRLDCHRRSRQRPGSFPAPTTRNSSGVPLSKHFLPPRLCFLEREGVHGLVSSLGCWFCPLYITHSQLDTLPSTKHRTDLRKALISLLFRSIQIPPEARPRAQKLAGNGPLPPPQSSTRPEGRAAAGRRRGQRKWRKSEGGMGGERGGKEPRTDEQRRSDRAEAESRTAPCAA